MKKLTFYFALLVAFSATNLFAGLKTSNAWFNNQDFSTYTAGSTDLTSTFGITKGNAGSFYVATTTTSTASNSGNALCFSRALVSPFAENGNASNCTKFFTSDNTTNGTKLYSSRYFYVKTAFYHCTGATYYTLRNSEGNTVFQFGGDNVGSSTSLLPAVMTTGYTNAVIGLGKRSNWTDIEFVIDLVNKKVVKCKLDNSFQTLKTYSFSDYALTITGSSDIKSLYINTLSFTGAGFDNASIGELEPDNIKDITTSQAVHQSLDGTTVTTTLGVTNFTNMMSTDLPFAGSTALDIKWKVSDWGGMPEADTLKITKTRGATDYTSYSLATSQAISADYTITVQAKYGSTILSKQVTIKSVDIAGLKSALLSEINSANGLMTAVTDANGYISSAKSTLSGVVTAAQGVYDNAAATVSDITTATTNLQSAKTAFNSSMATYNAFVAYIGTVTTGRDAEVRMAPYFTAIKANLTTAIDAATAAKTTVATAGDITTAQTTLDAAYTQFGSDKQVYDNLNNQITTVNNKLTAVNPRKGDSRFLMYPTANVDALSAAKVAAQNTLDNGVTATALNTANTDLQTALTTFGTLARVAPSASYYRIFTYGVNDGEGNNDKKVLFAYYDAGTSAYILKYANMSSVTALALGDNALWTITVGSANNKYTLLNKATGTYLSGTGFSATPAEFTFPENSSQAGLISYGTDTYTEYGIVNSSSKGLEVDAYDTNIKIGSFINNSSMANRFRFAYQFEIPATSTLSTIESSLPVFSGIPTVATNKTLTLSGTNLFGDIALSITGTDASLFSVAPTSISPINTIISANTITVTYTPQSTRTGYDEATLNIVAADGTAINYTLQGECLATRLNSNDQSLLNVYVSQRTLQVTGVDVYDVFDIQGLKVASVSNTPSKIILQPGIYFVKAANKTVKVFVK